MSLREDLLRSEAYVDYPLTGPVELCETHISQVFLLANDVFKVKKPVHLGFLDFRTLEQRKGACEAEVVLNQRLAKKVYRGTVAVRLGPDGRAQIGGTGEIIDWAVHMARVPDEKRADVLLERGLLAPRHLDALAKRIADFHASARSDEDVQAFGAAEVIAKNVEENFAQTEDSLATSLNQGEAEEIRRWQRSFLVEHAALFAERQNSQRIRDGHGDLRLEHAYFDEGGEVTVLDCIEFNDRFRFGDVASDVAFFSMDLASCHRVDLAEQFLALYARHSNDFDLYNLIDFYEGYRAFVRGKIAGFRLSDPSIDEATRRRALAEARKYFLLALSVERRSLLSPSVVAVGGIIASGKSTVAEAIGLEMSAPIVEADRTRKSMLGVSATAPVHEGAFRGAYDPAFTERVYEEVLRRGEVVLKSGRPVILDASFRSVAMRQGAKSLAERYGVPFRFVECRVPLEVARHRLEKRSKTASVSDGRLEILDRFVAEFVSATELSPEERLVLDTSLGLDESLQTLRRHVATWPKGLSG